MPEKEVLAYLSLGSNIDAEQNFELAVNKLVLFDQLNSFRISECYKTRAVGCEGFFFNAVMEFRTRLEPGVLKKELFRPLEQSMGRKRNENKNAARTIDIDLIVWGSCEFLDGNLVLPDPDILERDFLLLCLADLDPNLQIAGKSVKTWAVEKKWSAENNPNMEHLAELSLSLRNICS